jgi:SIR2-like domain
MSDNPIKVDIAIDDDSENDIVDMLSDCIAQNCVLLLGPQFGIDASNQKMHLTLKETLGSRFNLDEDFDNLYISRDSKESQAALLSQIKSFYRKVQPHPIYEELLKVGFSSIISLTADHLLTNADKDKAYDFKYFSRKGMISAKTADNDFGRAATNEKATSGNKPLIYNLFGSLEDTNSLITDYDSLYDFIIHIMKAEQEFPLQLRDFLGNVNALLFIGFDLSKWYIPLLIRKLNQFMNNSRVYTFACRNDSFGTATPYPPIFLNKYPLRFEPFNVHEPETLIRKLNARKKPATNGESRQPMLSDAAKSFFTDWHKKLLDYAVTEALDDFKEQYSGLGYQGPHKSDFGGLIMQYNELLKKKNGGKITYEVFNVEINTLSGSLIHFVEEII